MMDFLQLLGITEDADERAIKKAYRIKLRQHHPEEDPEGFKRVRQAYELAIAHRHHTFIVNREETIDVATQENESVLNEDSALNRDQTIAPSTSIENLVAILDDESRRFDEQTIADWAAKVQLIPLDEFEQLSSRTIDDILSRRWLPGEIIAVLFQCFDWAHWLFTNEKDHQLGVFIKAWSEQRTEIELSTLHQLDHAQQRSLLSFIRPLYDALEEGDIEAIEQLLSQPNPLNIYDYRPIMLKLCLVFQAGCKIPSSVMKSIVFTLLAPSNTELNTEQLALLGQCAQRLNEDSLLEMSSERLYQRGDYPEVCELNYQRYQSSDSETALFYAFLWQQLWPKPHAYWYAEFSPLSPPEDNERKKRQDWIVNTLCGQLYTVFSSPVELSSQNGFHGELFKALWCGSQGDWNSVYAQLTNLNEMASISEEHQKPLLTITQHWLNSVIKNRAGDASLHQKLEKYGQKGWFESESVTALEVESMDIEQWRDCIIRHPLLPDVWLNELYAGGIIDQDFLQESQKLPDFVYRLYHYRYYSDSYAITSPWQSMASEFDGLFQWAQVYYAQGSVNPRDQVGLIDYLPPLPEAYSETIFATLAEFLSVSNQYSAEAVALLDKHSEQYIAKYLINRQIQSLYQSDDVNALYSLAKRGDTCAYMALSWRLEREHISEAIIYWNLCAARCKDKPQFKYVLDWQQDSLVTLLEEQGLSQKEYQFHEASFIRVFLTTNKEWFSTPEELYKIEPDKDAKAFYFPMAILVTHLHLGMNKDGYEFEQLKELFRKRKLQTELQQITTDIAVEELDRMYQTSLANEIAAGNARSMMSKGESRWWLLFVMIAPLLLAFAEEPLNLNGLAAFGVLSFFIGNGIWSNRVSKCMTPAVNKKTSLIYVYTLLVLSVFFNPLFFAHLFALFFFTNNVSPIYANGTWNRKVYKSRRINMRKILGGGNQ